MTHAFDGAASNYDATFTNTRLGRWMRAAVWERLTPLFPTGSHVLELGCGTGEDAAWLAARGVRVTATDASPEMVATARAKAQSAGLAQLTSFAQLDMRRPQGADLRVPPGGFDGVLSNFGALNCVEDRRPLAEMLRHVVRPGGQVALVVMSPICPWEIAWYLGRGRPRDALRRFKPGVLVTVGDEQQIPVWYPSPRRVRRELAPAFRHVETLGIGAALPPPYLERVFERWPRLLATLARLEPHAARRFPWTWMNDHYLSIFERGSA